MGRHIQGSAEEPEVKQRFCEALERLGVVASAAKSVGISTSTAYHWRQCDSDFAQAWDEAYELSTAALEAGIYERAIHGVLKPVFQKGQLVGEYREFSVEREKMLWRTRRPELFKSSLEEALDKQQVILQFQPVAEPPPPPAPADKTSQTDGSIRGSIDADDD
jgi:hypothetical protein